MNAKEILGESYESLLPILGISPRLLLSAHLVREECDKYLNSVRELVLCNYPLDTLEQLERNIKLVTTSKELLEKAVLGEDKERNEVIVRIRALLGNQGQSWHKCCCCVYTTL